MRYVIQLAIAASHLINAALAGFADESLSARAWRQRHKRRWGFMRRAIDGAFRLFGQHDHCQTVYLAERARRLVPPELRA